MIKTVIREITIKLKKKEEKGTIDIHFRGDGHIKKEWVNRIVNPDKIVSSYYLDWLRERPDVTPAIRIKIPIIIEKMAHQGNKIHINIKEFAKELAISSGLEDRLTHHFGLPFKRESKPRKSIAERIKLAEDYEKLIEDGSFKTRAELARHLSVSRAWITKVMNIKKQ